jgi:hypothetical protein
VLNRYGRCADLKQPSGHPYLHAGRKRYPHRSPIDVRARQTFCEDIGRRLFVEP